MGCRNDQHEHCDFDLRDGKGSISLDTNLVTSFPAHASAPQLFKMLFAFRSPPHLLLRQEDVANPSIFRGEH